MRCAELYIMNLLECVRKFEILTPLYLFEAYHGTEKSCCIDMPALLWHLLGCIMQALEPTTTSLEF
jgi:hypothetical protein